ncbi:MULTISPECIES: hypothetical protein [Bradyrhizobium]|uniref:hypothetical protein n=1 Tax=Bradyrhizobium TaxID=374 RepID=UPI0012BD62A7|nr:MULTISPECIES: hypothetical protein [Bradyrhizobium]MCS3451530.1 hypothetical protein [Bradyrhizobium elkanii]MCS3566371.1 hypothetical protein [Bradyrhizobium elkanii]MCW2152900.1 hypothetical protein [Bradyrhizobium elkanii]MCW2357366.1 hypothetical protein [Bradyrhizobium elkanii]MCW2376632.1 hypothetical protein [Bradyrhizobium elkanii]
MREWLSERAAPILFWLGFKRPSRIDGLWKATFLFGPEQKPYCEVIKLKSSIGLLIGKIEPHPLNHEAVAAVADKRPIRLRGSIKEARHFTGDWMHPTEQSHELGAFHLYVDDNYREMDGLWLGYVRKRAKVEAGEWIWERMREENVLPTAVNPERKKDTL